MDYTLKRNFSPNSFSGPLTPDKWDKWTTQRYFKITLVVFILKYFKKIEITAVVQVHHLGTITFETYNFRLAKRRSKNKDTLLTAISQNGGLNGTW